MKDILFKPVFITSTGSSGYELLATLLDNHEHIVIMPYTLKFYSIYEDLNLAKEKNLNKLINIILTKTKLNRFVNGQHKLSNPNWVKKDIFHNLSKFNTSVFKKNLKSFLEKNILNRKNILIGIYMSFATAIGKEIKKIRVYFIDNTYNDNIDEILNDFENCNFLYLIRDPRETFISQSMQFFNEQHSMVLKNHRYKNLYVKILKETLAVNYNILKRLKLNSSINLMLIKFEDIHEKKEEIMKQLSIKYDFKFQNTLLETTILSQKSLSRSSLSKEPVTGTNVKRLSRYKKELSFFNIILIETIFNNTLKQNNYHISIKENNFKKIFFIFSYFYPLKNEILPSNLIFKTKYKQKIKNYFIYKLLKYFLYLIINLISFFVSRIINNYKIYQIKN